MLLNVTNAKLLVINPVLIIAPVFKSVCIALEVIDLLTALSKRTEASMFAPTVRITQISNLRHILITVVVLPALFTFGKWVLLSKKPLALLTRIF